LASISIPTPLEKVFQGCKTDSEIREKCYSVLTDQPTFHAVRVLLSKIYFSQGYVDFAIRELHVLKKHGDFPVADRILKELGEGDESTSGKKIVAEVSI